MLQTRFFAGFPGVSSGMECSIGGPGGVVWKAAREMVPFTTRQGIGATVEESGADGSPNDCSGGGVDVMEFANLCCPLEDVSFEIIFYMF